ncbi:proline iminopeptidase [Methylocaldum marinum]|uniref:Proline iminopeptidase n=1 Tax=Methylocaldum marinum TaxID=1432792 RepID=A0A250KR68_9GAMM|nr:prolyl aminopeptidase [Methylocaldum marinum]BBA34173.1 proline iminopeptidase [Methylocaldum marinum]
MKTLYPEIEPYAIHLFKRNRHHIHVEECGNPSGLPVVFLHGGPGSGCKAYHRRFFDPEKYRVVLVDQRGAGRSLPQGKLVGNTTADLIRDLEYIRHALQIERWLVFGGSWGATLGLVYAQRHPPKISGLVLRAAFLARQRDIDWFVGSGADRIYPEQWDRFMESIPEPERHRPLSYLYACLTGDDELARRRAARVWAQWSGQVIVGNEFEPSELTEHVSSEIVNQARIELHYAVNGYFIPENAILEQCGRIRRLPVILIHGRRDLVCPVESSFSLSRRLPNSGLRVLPNAGHIAAGEEMIDALVSAADEMAERLDS